MMQPGQIESVNAGLAGPAAENAILLRAKGVRAGYGKKEILHGVDLDVKAGEIVVLAGANGAGKSTFLKVVAGLLKPTAGSICLVGQDVTRLAVHSRSRLGVGYLLQGGEVFPSLTVRENLGVAAGDGAQDPNAIEPVLSLFPTLRARLQQRAGLLSGGERQMLALAMVLMTRPRLLLLDEPTAALAPSFAAETLGKISEYCNHQGMAVVLVEQRLREALCIAHRALALVLGRLALHTTDPRTWIDSPELHLRFLGDPLDPRAKLDSVDIPSSSRKEGQ
jgi:ABC-type branched-subunit amino acid transport system ATPase component